MQLRKSTLGYRSAGTPSSPPASGVGNILADTWTADGALYYYDLDHGRGRPVFVKAYDTFTGAVFPLADERIVAGDTDTTRVWTDSDPGASRVMLYYY